MKLNYKHILVLFFSMSLFLSIIIQSVYFIDYSFNNKSYTEKYCKNIALPEMNCKGSCHLAKQLKLKTQEQEIPTEGIQEFLVSIFTFQQINTLETSLLLTKDDSIFNLSNKEKLSSYIPFIFKPPCFA